MGSMECEGQRLAMPQTLQIGKIKHQVILQRLNVLLQSLLVYVHCVQAMPHVVFTTREQNKHVEFLRVLNLKHIKGNGSAKNH